jgi:hypothetical protein
MHVNKFIIRATIALSILGAGVAACSSDETAGHDHDDDHEFLDFCSLPKPCQNIVAACHSKDDGVSDAEIHECHETGHDVGTEAACSKVEADCVQRCNDAPSLGGAGESELDSCDDAGAG